MSDPEPRLIKRDQRGRVLMALGPVWWWIGGLVLIVVAAAIPIIELSPRDPLRRWVGVIFAVILIGYVVPAVMWWRSRTRRYRAELVREGLTHGEIG